MSVARVAAGAGLAAGTVAISALGFAAAGASIGVSIERGREDPSDPGIYSLRGIMAPAFAAPAVALAAVAANAGVVDGLQGPRWLGGIAAVAAAGASIATGVAGYNWEVNS